MFSFFGPRLPIDDDELDFQLATFKWLIGQFGPVGDTALVLPTPEFFPLSSAGRDDGVREIFDHVRAAAGMADWPCELRAGRRDRPVHAGNAHLLRHEGRAGAVRNLPGRGRACRAARHHHLQSRHGGRPGRAGRHLRP